MKKVVLENLYKLWGRGGSREKILDAFESKIFLAKSKGVLTPNHSELPILTPK